METDTKQLKLFDAAACALEFLTPRGHRGYRKPALDLPYSDETVPYRDGHLAIRRWGAGEPVLLVHGWSGSQSDLRSFVPAIVAAGFSAVTVDLKAHGDSTGETASLDELAQCVVAVAKHLGLLRAVIAHSVGCAATTIATSQSLAVERIAFIAPPESYENAVREFASMKGLEDSQAKALISELKIAGVRVNILASEYVSKLDVPGLIVHSIDDDVVPVETGKRVAALWKNCKFVEVHGLGHRKILRDSQVVDLVTKFISEKSPDLKSNHLDTNRTNSHV